MNRLSISKFLKIKSFPPKIFAEDNLRYIGEPMKVIKFNFPLTNYIIISIFYLLTGTVHSKYFSPEKNEERAQLSG